MATTITAQDAQILTKMKEVVPKLPQSSKDKLLTVVETMGLLHEAKPAPMAHAAACRAAV